MHFKLAGLFLFDLLYIAWDKMLTQASTVTHTKRMTYKQTQCLINIHAHELADPPFPHTHSHTNTSALLHSYYRWNAAHPKWTLSYMYTKTYGCLFAVTQRLLLLCKWAGLQVPTVELLASTVLSWRLFVSNPNLLLLQSPDVRADQDTLSRLHKC